MTDLSRLTAALSDRYTIEQEVGAGGMATVYLAHDVKHGWHTCPMNHAVSKCTFAG